MNRIWITLALIGGLGAGFTLKSVLSSEAGRDRAPHPSRGSAVSAVILERLKLIEERLASQERRAAANSPTASDAAVTVPAATTSDMREPAFEDRKLRELARVEALIERCAKIVESPLAASSPEARFHRSLKRQELSLARGVKDQLERAEDERDLEKALEGLQIAAFTKKD